MPSGFPSSHERQASLNLLPVAPSYLVTLGKKAFSSSCHGDLELSPAVTEAEGAAGCRLLGRGSPPAQAGPRRPLRHRAATPNSLWGAAGPPHPHWRRASGSQHRRCWRPGPTGSPPASLSHRRLQLHVHGSLDGSGCQGARPASCSKCPRRGGHTATDSRTCVCGESV